MMKNMKRIKRIICLVLVMLMAAAVMPYIVSADTPITLVVQGKIVKTDVPPVIENGRTLVPVRALMEAFTVELDSGNVVPVFVVSWDEDSKTVTISSWFTDAAILELTIDSRFATVYAFAEMGDEEIVEMDVPARIINGRTMIPARFVSEQLGYDVSWDSNTRTVSVD